MPAYDLDGKVALVTGAARGIGFEAARQMQVRGASVAVVDLDAGRGRGGGAADRAADDRIAADVSDREQIEAAVARTVEEFGCLDVAVANAGIAPEVGSTLAIGTAEWERVIEVNLLGVWRTVRAAMPQVVERRGHLVLVASVYAFVNGAMLSSYATAKAGVESLGRSLRAELAPHGAGASVAYFGFIDTKMVRRGSRIRSPSASRSHLLPGLGRRQAAARRRRAGDRRGGRGAPAADRRPVVVAGDAVAPRDPQPAARPPARRQRGGRGDRPRRATPRRRPRGRPQATPADVAPRPGSAPRAGRSATRTRARWRARSPTSQVRLLAEVGVEAARPHLLRLFAGRGGGQLRVQEAAVAGEPAAGRAGPARGPRR